MENFRLKISMIKELLEYIFKYKDFEIRSLQVLKTFLRSYLIINVHRVNLFVVGISYSKNPERHVSLMIAFFS